MKIYSTIQWGQLANFHMMDIRQHRDDKLASEGWKRTPPDAWPKTPLLQVQVEDALGCVAGN